MALESEGIYRWLWTVGASTGGFGECGHHQGLWSLQVALESGGKSRWLWSVGASPGGFGVWGHLQVALESVGITRWLWRVGASTGGFGEWGHRLLLTNLLKLVKSSLGKIVHK